MTSSVINTYVTNKTEELPGDFDDLLVTPSGSIVNTNADSGVDSSGDNDAITVDGLVYSIDVGFGTGVIITGGSTTLNINGQVQGDSAVAIDGGSNDSITVGSQGQVDGVAGVGVYFQLESNDSLTNAGDISGAVNGVSFGFDCDSDVLINSGQISGSLAVVNSNSVGKENVENSGTIEGISAAIYSDASSVGINIINSGLLTDSSVNTLGGSSAVLFFHDNAGTTSTIDNTGTISGLGYVIQSVSDALDISNAGTIDGGIYLAGSDNSLTNSQSGTITGAINFTGAADTIDNAGKIDGAITLVAGGDGFTNAGGIDGAVTFTGSGLTNTFTNTGSITGDFTFSSVDSTLSNDGQIYGNVTLADPDTLNNTGIIDGNVTLGAGDTFNDSQGGAVTGPITASTSNLFEFSGHFGNETIANFTGGTGTTHDTIQFSADDFASFMAVQNAMLQVGPDVVITLDSTDSVTLENVSSSNLVFADFQFVCFMADTMISTPGGKVAIQTLRRGDYVMTTDDRVAMVSWIGRQTVSTRFADPLRYLPIRIKASALSVDVPSRDLLVSPDHAILVDDVLIQAGALVNSTSIVWEANVPETFTYYHVELKDHSLILAENAPAETFVDNVDRAHFDNWREHEALYPEDKSIAEMPYPRAKAFRQVPRSIRERLAQRGAALYGAHVAAA
jgi:Hint domain